MYFTSIKIGACHHAHAQNEDKEAALLETIELSRKIVDWKDGAKPRFTIVYPNGKQYGRNVAV
jgi:hypothetical protein